MIKNTLNVLVACKRADKDPIVEALISHREINQLYVTDKIAESLKICGDHCIDAIIIDFFMQDGSVLDFLQNNRAVVNARIPILVLSDQNAHALHVCAYRKGAAQVILKDEHNRYIKYLYKYIKKLHDDNILHIPIMQPKMNINNAVICVNKDLDITFLNAAATGYLSATQSNMIGKSILRIVKNVDIAMSRALKEGFRLAQDSHQPQPIGTFKLTKIEHDLSYIEIMLYPILNIHQHIDAYIVNLRERTITNQQDIERYQHHEYDYLTGVLNRESFMSRLNHVLIYCSRYDQNCAIVHLDIDGFKAMNDALGHRLADQLLKEVSKRIKILVRNVDILARIGADEFMLLLSHTNQLQDSARVADKLMQALKEPFVIEQNPYFVTMSVGIAMYPQDADTLDGIIQCANSALRLAKEKGRNNYQFYRPEFTRQATSVIELVNDMHIAMEKQEFDLYFQPQFCAQDQHLIGFEALLRWQHPTKGNISPALFIPIAEQMGMINEIGDWVIQRTCQTMHKLKLAGYTNFIMAINLSVQQLMREDFVDEIIKILAHYDVPAHRIELEITESIFAHDKPLIISKLQALQSAGFHIVMDDFGTGYSCLSYIKDLPLEGIKIDKAFVDELSSDAQSKFKAIISAIITLAQQLNIKTLAEGIESLEQATMLRNLGCDHLQGFLFAKPLSYDETLLFLEEKIEKDNLSATG